MKESEFLAWFVRQHGQRASGLMMDRSDDQLRGMIQAGKIAAAQLEARKEWDARQASALYAWQARDKA